MQYYITILFATISKLKLCLQYQIIELKNIQIIKSMYSNNQKNRSIPNMRIQFINKSNNRHRRDYSSEEDDHQQRWRKKIYKKKNQRQRQRYQQQISVSSSSNSKEEKKDRKNGNGKGVEGDKKNEEDDGVIRFDNQSQKSVGQKDIIPWMSNGTRTIKDTLLRFHNQIIEFYNYIKPSKKGHATKLKKFNFIRDQIMEIFPKADVIAFGSFATQLYLPDGDIDIAVLTNNEYSPSQIYTSINKHLQSHHSLFSNIDYIRKSKVPLIKFEYEHTQFDISVDKTDGIAQIKYIQKINELFPQFKYLTLVLKCTLRIRGLSDTYTGGIGSFLLSCMLWVYLKNMHEKKCYFNLGEHVLEFIKFYAANDEFWRNKVVYVKDGRIGDRHFDGAFFSCISPQDESHDIGKSAFKIKQVFNVLKNRCRYILDKNFNPQQSILRVLVNPSDIAFKYLKQKQ